MPNSRPAIASPTGTTLRAAATHLRNTPRLVRPDLVEPLATILDQAANYADTFGNGRDTTATLILARALTTSTDPQFRWWVQDGEERSRGAAIESGDAL